MNTRGELRALPPEALSILCYQLALMQRAGIHSEEGVVLLLEESTPPVDRQLLERVHAALLQGAPLDSALEQAGGFPPYLLRMVSIGQASGRLDQVLESLSSYYRREAATQSAIRQAVAYPSFMAVLIALVFLVLIARVLPVFQQAFDQLGMTLSPLAQGLMQLGSASRGIAVVLAVLLALGALFLLYLSRGKGGRALSRRLAAGLFGGSTPVQAVGRGRFASAMSLMLSSGLPLDEAMDRTLHLLEETALAPRLQDCRDRMAAGADFPQAVEAAGLLPPLQAGLLAAGFRTGAGELAMEELARRCQEEADEALGRMLGRFEYGLVLALCAAVGLVLLSVMLPLLSVMSTIGA